MLLLSEAEMSATVMQHCGSSLYSGCTPLTQSTFQCLASSAPAFQHAASAVGRRRAALTPSLVHKFRVMSVSYMLVSRHHIHMAGISETHYLWPSPAHTAFCKLIYNNGGGTQARGYSSHGDTSTEFCSAIICSLILDVITQIPEVE